MMGLYVAPSLARADAASDYGAAVLADHPVSYWRLNDPPGSSMAADQEGLNQGQITGATLGEPGPLAGSGSMRFEGNGDVNLGTDPSLRPPNNWTVEAWFKASTTDTANCVNTYHSSGCALYAVHAFGLHLVLEPQGHIYGFFDSNSNEQSYSVMSPHIYDDDAWHYIVLVRDTAQLRLYIDGSEVANTAVGEPTTYYCCEDIATIANDDACRCVPFTGWESEIAFYNYPLTATQVEAHYAAGTGLSPPGGGGGGSTPIPVPSTGGGCVAGTPKCQPLRPQGVACPACSNYDGAYNQFPYTHIGGIYARVRNYTPWVDPASYSVSAWVGLQYCGPPVPNGCNENELAQIGWREQPHGQRDTLVEYLLPGRNFSDCNPKAVGFGTNNLTCNSIPIPAAPASYSYYTILYGYEPGRFTFYVDGHKVANAPAGFVPNQAEVYGETNLIGDQMPGDANDPEVFEDINVYLNGAWQPFTPTHVSRTSYRGTSYSGYLQSHSPGHGTCLGIWDTTYGDASARVNAICRAGARAATKVAAISVPASQHVGSSAVVPLSCPSGAAACGGTILLQQSPTHGRLARIKTPPHLVARPTVFALPPGGRERLRLRFTRTALRKLRTAGRLRVRAVIVANSTGAHASHIASRNFTLLK